MRGFGRFRKELNRPNPLTPTLSPLGRGGSLRQLRCILIAKRSRSRARLGARVFLRAIGNASRGREVRSRQSRNRFGAGKGQGWGLLFVRPLRELCRSKLQVINGGSGTPANAGSPTAASCDAARALLERARLTAFHHGSHLRELFHPKGSASGQASWDVVRTGVTRLRLSQSRDAPPTPVIVPGG